MLIYKSEYKEYTGDEINGMPNGYGTMKLKNGTKIVGHFDDGDLD